LQNRFMWNPPDFFFGETELRRTRPWGAPSGFHVSPKGLAALT